MNPPGRSPWWRGAALIALTLLLSALGWRAWRVEHAARHEHDAADVQLVAPAPAAPIAPVREPVTMPPSLSSPEHAASRARADAALLEISMQSERDLIRGNALHPQRAREAVSTDEFLALIDGFALQSQHDDAKAQIGGLLADQVARGFLRLHSDALLEQLHCGLRLCAARVHAARPDAEIDLPFPSARIAVPHADGGSDIRIVFAIDPAIVGLHMQPPLQ